MSFLFTSINPHTGQAGLEFSEESLDSLEVKLNKLHQGYVQERNVPLEGRIQKLKTLETLLANESQVCVELMATEMGKPFVQGLEEIQKCRDACLYFAEHADRYLAPHYYEDGAVAVLSPKGIILAIMPWNFPFWQAFRFIIPSILLGNSVLLKHAPNVPQCAAKIDALFKAAGLDSLFQNAYLSHDQIQDLLADSRIQGVTLTGSVSAGRAVAAQAGKYGKPSVLELGGSDAWIICDDADISKAIEVTCASKLTNAGQVCIAAKRIYCHVSHYETLLAGLRAAFDNAVIGDPLLLTTGMGPLARKDLQEKLNRQVKESIEMGAVSHPVRQQMPNQGLPESGWYVSPTLLTNVTPDMPVLKEECFGPVAVVIPFKDDREVVAHANATEFGLGASVWTASSERALWFASQLDVGTVAVNARVRTQFHLPFGGTKASGFGRELGEDGFKSFANLKVIA